MAPFELRILFSLFLAGPVQLAHRCSHAQVAQCHAGHSASNLFNMTELFSTGPKVHSFLFQQNKYNIVKVMRYYIKNPCSPSTFL